MPKEEDGFPINNVGNDPFKTNFSEKKTTWVFHQSSLGSFRVKTYTYFSMFVRGIGVTSGQHESCFLHCFIKAAQDTPSACCGEECANVIR